MGGEPEQIIGLESGEFPVAWTADGNSVYALRQDAFPVRVFIVNVKSGERKLWKEIIPSDLAGAQLPINLLVTPDGSAYVYTYRRLLSDLYLVKDLK
jgi:hypothetical protein